MSDTIDRNEAIQTIRAELKRRSGKSWSVTGGRGTGWGWITITSPPSRSPGYGELSPEDQAELSNLLDKDVHHQGELVPASSAYRREAIERARGIEPAALAKPYWD